MGNDLRQFGHVIWAAIGAAAGRGGGAGGVAACNGFPQRAHVGEDVGFIFPQEAHRM